MYADEFCQLTGKVCETKALVDSVDRKNDLAIECVIEEIRKTNEMIKKNAVALETQLENRLKKIEVMLEQIQIGSITENNQNDQA